MYVGLQIARGATKGIKYTVVYEKKPSGIAGRVTGSVTLVNPATAALTLTGVKFNLKQVSPVHMSVDLQRWDIRVCRPML